MSDLKDYQRVKYIDTYVHHDHRVGVLIEYISDTSIPGQDKSFQDHVRHTAMLVASVNPSSVNELLEQDSIKDPKKKISDLVSGLTEKYRENIQINRFLRWDTEIKPSDFEDPEPPPEASAAALRAVK